MAGRIGYGLRLQIIVALAVALAFASVLLGSVALQLSERQLVRSREAYAQVAADAIAAVERGEDPAALASIEELAASREAAGFQRNIRRLFVLYCVFTAGAVLLFAYGALTQLIVRPVEVLTRASERMASGNLAVSVPTRGSSELSRLSGAFNDMAAQLRADRAALEARFHELERANDELRTAQEQVVRSEKLASVGRLSAGVAHEIGNPLAAVLGFVELLKGGGLAPEEERAFLERIESETERIHVIIRDLLEFSRTGSEVFDDEGASCDLAEVVEDAVKLVAPQGDLGRIDIETRVEEELPRVRGEAARHTQVLLNLLLNAADALPQGGQIRVELSGQGGAVELCVSDNGPGIAESVRAQLFEPFVTTKPAGEGTGLGLAVCHTIVERLGGSIRAENPAEGGARFVVSLPTLSLPTLGLPTLGLPIAASESDS